MKSCVISHRYVLVHNCPTLLVKIKRFRWYSFQKQILTNCKIDLSGNFISLIFKRMHLVVCFFSWSSSKKSDHLLETVCIYFKLFLTDLWRLCIVLLQLFYFRCCAMFISMTDRESIAICQHSISKNEYE